jgi:hypothetical protein
MSPTLVQALLKTAGLVAAIVALIFFGYVKGEAHKQLEIDAADTARAKAVAARVAADAELIKSNAVKIHEGDMQHEKDMVVISDLSKRIDRVRVHIPTTGDCAMSSVAEAGTGSSDAAGVFSNRVDAAFEQLQEGISRLTKTCDTLNADATRLNASLK